MIMNKRLKVVEAKPVQEGLVLTESQLGALERVKLEKETHGGFESECPRLLQRPRHVLSRYAQRPWVASISRPLSMPTRRWRSPNSTTVRHGCQLTAIRRPMGCPELHGLRQ
ncbi:UNVERIFIED_ORG: hypothetical protein J2Y81_008003 [Paraburkholderia sediminicola]|nr:hypothetical protein [Paraburkholderia sediminicola]